MLGSVDHGKSTLVGRLLHDLGLLPEGRLEEIRAVSRRRGLDLELAFALDALRAERDQGITIDVAHVSLRTPGREYRIADAPGHEELLRNMVTGAASADAGLLLVDALEGVRDQTRRHAYLARLLGLPQLAVVVNKMDLVERPEEAFRRIEADILAFLPGAVCVPASAKEGWNVAARAPSLGWHRGPTVLEVMQGFRPPVPPWDAPLRLPVQDVYRIGDRRIIAGRIESGTLKVGDEVVFSPWNKTGFVRSIEQWGRPPAASARAGESVGITLDTQLFVERGQVVSHVEEAPVETDVIDARVFWLGAGDLAPGREYRIKIATQEAACRVEAVHRVIDVRTLGSGPASGVPRNGVGEVTLRIARPVAIDDGGRFVLQDAHRISGGGVASTAGTTDLRPRLSGWKSEHISFAPGRVTRDDRARRTGHRGRVVWFTGLPASGKSTIATALERVLFDAGFLAFRLDGDDLRHGLSSDLGFGAADRAENVRRAGEVARILCDAGLIVLVSLISPDRAARDAVRARHRQGEFLEVWADCPVEECARRDPKGLYRAAREGRVKGLTGVDAPYEPPTAAEVVLRTAELDVEACVSTLMEHLKKTS